MREWGWEVRQPGRDARFTVRAIQEFFDAILSLGEISLERLSQIQQVIVSTSSGSMVLNNSGKLSFEEDSSVRVVVLVVQVVPSIRDGSSPYWQVPGSCPAPDGSSGQLCDRISSWQI